MAYTIEINEEVKTVFCFRDMMELIEEEHRKELDGIRDHYHNVISEIHEESKQLSDLIRAVKLDRKAISSCAGRIGTITWRVL